MKFKLNLDQHGNFDPIPPGEYTAYLYNVKATTFSSGNQGYKLTFKIAEGPHQGRQVFDNLVFVDSAHWKIAQFWKAMTNDTGEVEIDTEAIPSFIGNKVGLRVDVENTDQGTKRNVVKGMFYIGGKASVEQDIFSKMLAGDTEPVNITEENVPF